MASAALTLADGRTVEVDPFQVATSNDHVSAFVKWQATWRATARDSQIPVFSNWTQYGYLAGRGYGKTRVGSEWLTRSVFLDPSGFDSCVICPTFSDTKFTAFEGESGILSVLPHELLVEYNKSDMIIRMRNVAGGVSTIRGFSAEKPERLRGPQHCRGWFDELAAWQYDEDTWDMAMMGLRLGTNPQVLWTTTPKPKELIRKLSAPQEGRVIERGSTFDNKANLPESFFKQLEQYEGTTLGRQELYGELVDPEEAGIVKRSDFRLWPAKRPLPPLDYIILSLDTAFTEATYDKKKGDADSTACIVLGSFHDKEGNSHLMLLDCWSEQMGMPDLLKRVKRELNVSYGDDQDTALIKPMFGSAKPLTSGRKPDLCLIEDKGSGISLRQMLEREGIEAYAYNPGRADKLARLHMVSHIFARKRVWLPESDKFPGRPRTWVEPMLAQLCAFTGPGSIKHDDYVDAMTQCIRLCIDKNLVSVLKTAKPGEVHRPPPKVVPNPYAL
jgi:predicted phage terminase large subunit-like protein